MNQFQPIQDTFCVLAGGAVPRKTRPGEKFEMPEKHGTTRHKGFLIRELIISILLRIRV